MAVTLFYADSRYLVGTVLRGFGFKTFFILKCLDFKAFVLKFFYFKALHF